MVLDCDVDVVEFIVAAAANFSILGPQRSGTSPLLTCWIAFQGNETISYRRINIPLSLMLVVEMHIQVLLSTYTVLCNISIAKSLVLINGSREITTMFFG